MCFAVHALNGALGPALTWSSPGSICFRMHLLPKDWLTARLCHPRLPRLFGYVHSRPSGKRSCALMPSRMLPRRLPDPRCEGLLPLDPKSLGTAWRLALLFKSAVALIGLIGPACYCCLLPSPAAPRRTADAFGPPFCGAALEPTTCSDMQMLQTSLDIALLGWKNGPAQGKKQAASLTCSSNFPQGAPSEKELGLGSAEARALGPIKLEALQSRSIRDALRASGRNVFVRKSVSSTRKTCRGRKAFLLSLPSASGGHGQLLKDSMKRLT